MRRYLADKYAARTSTHWWSVNKLNDLIDRGASVYVLTCPYPRRRARPNVHTSACRKGI